MKTRTLLLVSLLAFGFLPMAEAGSQEAPEITDASEDQALSGGGPLQAVLDLLPPTADDFADVDILKAWVTETDDTTFTIGIESSGAVADDTTTVVRFSADLGPTSVFGSTADGSEVAIQLTGNTVDSGPANTTAASNGAVMTITLTHADAGISGGDVFRNFTVDRSRSTDGLLPVVAPGQDATDSAGPGTDYTFMRGPVTGAGTAHVMGGMVGEFDFEGDSVHLHDDLVGHFMVHVTNTGSDVDDFELHSTVSTGVAEVSVEPHMFTLDPMGEMMAMVNFNATGAEDLVVIDMHLASGNGADVMFNLTLEIEAHGGGGGGGGGHGEGDEARSVTPSFLEFLTPAAEATTFDDLFGDYAELVLLLLILLLLILLILLLLMLLRKGWLQGEADPKSITAGPGEEVEFGITVQNRRKDFHGVHATFASEGATAGLTMKPEDGAPMDALTEEGEVSSFDLMGKGELGDFAEGTLTVRAPEEEGKHHVDVWFTPLDDEGEPLTKKATRVRTTVKVVDGEVADVPALSLGDIHHSPAHPVEGDNVLTTTSVNNDGEEDASLRVVLLVDNEPIQQETVHLRAGTSANVEFPWTAARGKNKIRVQVFEA